MNYITHNRLVLNDSGVLGLEGHDSFSYSDGASSEKYLHKVFESVKDLSSESYELETYIKDWASEYHLSRKRAQLLSGFKYDSGMRALEVGCGCGAITRFLGENFKEVVSVEGNPVRARLARMRTEDLNNVTIVCAPFQEIQFKEKFDIIFCIGVFEYSGAFIRGDDPYDSALNYFSNMLTPNGVLVIAIENQFGLKYFSSASEDHFGEMYVGLEGYSRVPDTARTFGKVELENMIARYFNTSSFFYPYPDYKIPDCVLSGDFVKSGRASELISQLKNRDYTRNTKPLWNESLAVFELGRNKMLEFFANSFIVIAGVTKIESVTFPQQGIIYSSGRVPEFSTRTYITGSVSGDLDVTKQLSSKKYEYKSGELSIFGVHGKWQNACSLETVMLSSVVLPTQQIGDIFHHAKSWVNYMIANARVCDTEIILDGSHLDSIWCNSYVVDGEVRVIDREFVWNKDLSLNIIAIRAIHNFLTKIDDYPTPVATVLRVSSGYKLIDSIARTLGLKLKLKDFIAFVGIESEVRVRVFKESKLKHKFLLCWYLFDKRSLRVSMALVNKFNDIVYRIVDLLKRII